MSPHHPFLRSQDSHDQQPQDLRSRGDRSVGQDLDNIFRLTAAQPAAAHQPATERTRAGDNRRVTQSDLDAALEMLNRAGKAMDLMQARYQHVEDYAKGVADRAEKDVAVAYAQAREWEVRAARSEGKLEEFRDRAEEAERRADEAERSAKEARDWLECFYDKIITSFDTRTILKAHAA